MRQIKVVHLLGSGSPVEVNIVPRDEFTKTWMKDNDSILIKLR